MTSGVELLYSTDETNDWKTLDENTVIECNNAINIKFAGAKPTGTIGKGLHYVEKTTNIINILMMNNQWNGEQYVLVML